MVDVGGNWKYRSFENIIKPKFVLGSRAHGGDVELPGTGDEERCGYGSLENALQNRLAINSGSRARPASIQGCRSADKPSKLRLKSRGDI